MFLRIRRASSKIINLVVFFIMLAPSLAGIYSVQAATIETEVILSRSSLPKQDSSTFLPS